ncbi:universal stress protein [Palleronia caenipelagi]|uniref:Universal stress protein n=1 Tax=Palleronia caenipelagi TaxID=2489174 RepID=A0A547PTE8_9RHOB|nr:universal stress protein [Palleronia caenipelagi]TRD17371.1 universal stress protein [Palleronia caenipelagi]
MAYKTVAAIAGLGSLDALDAAMDFCARHEAHLHVLCVSPSYIESSAMMATDYVAAAPVMVEAALHDAEEIERKTREKLKTHPYPCTVDSRRDLAVNRSLSVLRAMRFADVAFLPRPVGDSAAQIGPVVEEVLRHTRIPVIIAPEGKVVEAKRIMIAWDGGEVALAAVRAAMPLLKRAETVEIATVDPDDETEGHDLAVMLDRHGIAAAVTELKGTKKTAGQVLRTHAFESDVDLVVQGAYSHNRLRDMLLGGVTKHMLGDTTVPVLLAR